MTDLEETARRLNECIDANCGTDDHDDRIADVRTLLTAALVDDREIRDIIERAAQDAATLPILAVMGDGRLAAIATGFVTALRHLHNELFRARAAVAENAALRVDLRAALSRLAHAHAREDAARSLLRECAQWVLVPLPAALLERVRAFMDLP